MARFSLSEKIEAAKDVVRTDATTNHVKTIVREGAPRLPGATGRYLANKLPIIEWLPRYNPSWLLQDFVAGLTLGVMLIPQGLAYAKIATIPIENGLYASWLPGILYVFMGTSKDLSTGPTSMLGLLTANVVDSLKDQYTPTAIASAVTFMVGIYALCLGLLGLGFLLDYVSVPVLTGFISATALTIGFGQVGSLVGLDNTPSNIFDIIGNVLRRLPDWNGPTCGVGIASIIILIVLEKVGKRWGKKHFLIKYLSSSRAIIVLFIFTLISFLVNHGKSSKDYLWEVAEVSTNGIVSPKKPDATLLGKVASGSLAPLIACSLEHLAVGKAFGRRNGYTIDQTQELAYLGVTNLINGFFSVVAVGGAMSRTAVNSECRVRSPLGGIVTTAWLLLTLYCISPALYWIPKTVLSAIIIMAVVHLFGPVSLFYYYWRVSLADFIAAMLSFWLTIFQTAEIGIGAAVAWNIVWTLLRAAFTRPSVHHSTEGTSVNNNSNNDTPNTQFPPSPGILPSAMTDKDNTDDTRLEHADFAIPDDVVVIHFKDTIFYPNAQRGKMTSFETVQLLFEKITHREINADPRERSWSVATEKRVQRLRRERNIAPRQTHLSAVVFDLTMVPFIDTTGVLALEELQQDIRLYAGLEVQFRLVGVKKGVKERLERAKWNLADVDGTREEGATATVYPSVERAVMDRRGSVLEAVVTEKDEELKE